MLPWSEGLALVPVLAGSDKVDRYIFHGRNDTPRLFCFVHGVSTGFVPWQVV